ncbi:hypothetical protein RN001_006334 [Aquatica leii]|uniref:Elongator complex protein 4 n=1 Tax=Aquatica leii TaxID=1421715 RepID=A0AAN7P7S9_9COLE|nr:hypothetical protein RN001_006334 [Aquatica leii]
MGEPTKLSKSVLNIPGTKPNIQNSQLLTSSGIPSLDELLGGGIPVGTVFLIEEDQQGTYAKIILKYFLAEGIVNEHSTFIASQDTSTDNIMQELPDVISFDPEPDISNTSDDTKMKIAFRYQNLPTGERELDIGHHYDLTRHMPRETLEQADVTHWSRPIYDGAAPDTFSNVHYHHLLENIKKKIQDGQFTLTDKVKRRSILRVGLHALGSPMWLHVLGEEATINQNRDLSMFIFCLRALMRMSLAVAVVTVPSHLFEMPILDRCVYSSDIAIKLQSFEGTELERNPVLQDYQGYFQLNKLAAINSFSSKHPGSAEYVFKLRRRKFCIEKLHLPPGFSDSVSKDPISATCGSNTKHLLEF